MKDYDAIVIGGGHNGLVAACYLARAGLSVLVLEQNIRLGGAAAGRKMFAGIDMVVPEYAYLTSLFPKQIITELGLNFLSKQRRIDSYTPYSKNGLYRGLKIGGKRTDTRESFVQLTGSDYEYGSYQYFLQLKWAFANVVWPTMMEPLVSRGAFEAKFKTPPELAALIDFVCQPLEHFIEGNFNEDLVRGLVFTDAKIGALTHPDDQNLSQNKTFLYHIIGRRMGDWQVPVGGTEALVSELEKAALGYGAEIMTNARVLKLKTDGEKSAVVFDLLGEGRQEAQAKFILANVAPAVLSRLVGEKFDFSEGQEGSVFKVNMLLRRLPILKAEAINPKTAGGCFAGTMHINEGYENMKNSYQAAVESRLPNHPPFDIYCHTLTDRSILSPDLRESGCHSLTMFGLDVPYRLFKPPVGLTNNELISRYLEELNEYLIEPVEDLMIKDENGQPCLQGKNPVEIERELGMPLGNIFHAPLSWPFAENDEKIGRWGVETQWKNIFICGAGAKRGGGVSGIPGRNAAMAVIEQITTSA